MGALKVRPRDTNITQGKVDELVTHLQLAEQHDLSIDRGIINSKILYVHSLRRTLEAEKTSITGLILDGRVRNRQTLDLHRIIVLSNVEDPSQEVDHANILLRLNRNLVKQEVKLLLSDLRIVINGFYAIENVPIDVLVNCKGSILDTNSIGICEGYEIQIYIPLKREILNRQ